LLGFGRGFATRKNLHAFSYWCGTGWQWFAELLNLNQAHAAVSSYGKFLVITKARYLNTKRVGGINDCAAGLNFYWLAIYFNL
jgi:hypothetical protein